MRKYTFDIVYDIFKKQGCVLISKNYKTTSQKLKYRCSCGNIAYIRFSSFLIGGRCKFCRYHRALKTNKKNHNGVSHFQTTEFLEKRKKTNIKNFGVDSPLKCDSIKKRVENTNLKKYGVKYTFQNSDCKKKSKETFKRKYGVEYYMQTSYAKEQFKKILLEKYGVPSLAYFSKKASKISQKLFEIVYSKLPETLKNKTYFATNNGEFVTSYNKKYYKYDFVNTITKKCIEFNGSKFHPKSTQKSCEIGWCVFHPKLTVKDARIYEKMKYYALTVQGYEILTIWDYELKNDNTINRCVNFITNNVIEGDLLCQN